MRERKSQIVRDIKIEREKDREKGRKIDNEVT